MDKKEVILKKTAKKVGSNNKKEILFVGRIVKRKGVRYLIDSLPIVLQKYPETLLKIVGAGLELSKLQDIVKEKKIDKVVAIDGVVFLFGALVDNKLKIGLILIRKKGTVPSPSYKTTFIDYSKKRRTLEIKKAALIHNGERLLIVDDWAETGAHLRSTMKILKNFQSKIVGISLLVNEMNPEQRKTLSKYNIREIIDFSKIQKPS